MIDYWQKLRHADDQQVLREMAYHYLLEEHRIRPWVHIGESKTALTSAARRSAGLLGVPWRFHRAGDTDRAEKDHGNVLVDGDNLDVESFETLLNQHAAAADSGVLCGTGFFTSQTHRQLLLERLPNQIAILQSSLWWVQPDSPTSLSGRCGAVCLPCFRDTRLVEQNLAWRSELFAGLDVHLFDDNYEPVENERLSALSRQCGWHYHQSGLGEHEDLAHEQADFSIYNQFIWESLTSLTGQYDFVIKIDTDTCLLKPDWWHEASRRLTDEPAMLGTFELRPLYQVASFWNTAWSHGWWRKAPAFPVALQGGCYAINDAGLQRLKAMGFLRGPHRTFTEDGYMSYCAQCLGIRLLPATTTGSWTNVTRPPLDYVDHLKAIHPLTHREWDEFLSDDKMESRTAALAAPTQAT